MKNSKILQLFAALLVSLLIFSCSSAQDETATIQIPTGGPMYDQIISPTGAPLYITFAVKVNGGDEKLTNSNQIYSTPSTYNFAIDFNAGDKVDLIGYITAQKIETVGRYFATYKGSTSKTLSEGINQLSMELYPTQEWIEVK